MRNAARWLVLALVISIWPNCQALAFGGFGHRTVAAIAQMLIPDKAAQMNKVLGQLETDNNFVDAASYPDEYVRNHDPAHAFNSWHFADLPDDGQQFDCGNCLFKALPDNLAIIREGKGDKDEAVAIAWVIHLVGDLHQPLHMDERLRGGNDFAVTYRGKKTCKNYSGGRAKVELHSVWDDCLVEELANGKTPEELAKALLGGITQYQGRPEIDPSDDAPWLKWGDESHALAQSVAFDDLQEGADLDDAYIVGDGKALSVVQRELLIAGIRLAYLLDKNFTQ